MDRKEIKELAKSKIKGNKWNIIWPILVISVIESILNSIFSGRIEVDFTNLESISLVNISPRYYIGSTLVTLIIGIITAGYLKYILNFVRTGKFEFNDIIDTVKAKWLNLLIAEILTTIIVALCAMLFVIPGIIMAIAYTFVTYLVIDTDVSGSDSLKKSREMMKGYKWNYFVFGLSFIGWIILIPFTLGLILIWLYPYMTVANTIYYEKLKELDSKK